MLNSKFRDDFTLGIAICTATMSQRPITTIPDRRKSRSKTARPQTLEQKLKSVGINWKKGHDDVKVLGRAIASINKQLKSSGVGIYRREHLLSLRAAFLRRISKSGEVHVVSGGLPSLGKRR